MPIVKVEEKFCFALRIVSTTPQRKYVDFVMERCFHMEKGEIADSRYHKRRELYECNFRIKLMDMKDKVIEMGFMAYPAFNNSSTRPGLFCWGDAVYKDNNIARVTHRYFKSLLVSFPEFKKTVPDKYKFSVDKQDPNLIYL